MSPCLRQIATGMPTSSAGNAETEGAPTEVAGTLKEGITHRRVFFSPLEQPNETSMSLGYVQWAQQLEEAR